MPYKIKAVSSSGHSVTRMDLDYKQRPISDAKYAQQLADEFALTRGRRMEWKGVIEYYAEKDSIANPNWDRSTGTLSK